MCFLALSIFVITISHFLLNHSFPLPFLRSPLCHHQSAMPWSHVFPSPYPLLFLHYSTSSSSSLSSPSLPPSQITTLLSFLHYHSSYIFSSSSSSLRLPSPPLTPGCVPCLHHPHHHPDHLPHGPRGTVFVCVGCTVLYKSCMLMQQKAAEHYGEWTNFRSAWPHFITAHKPKVSCVRWRGKSVPCSTWIIYHPARSALPSPSCFLSLVFKRSSHADPHLNGNLRLCLFILSYPLPGLSPRLSSSLCLSLLSLSTGIIYLLFSPPFSLLPPVFFLSVQQTHFVQLHFSLPVIFSLLVDIIGIIFC